MSAASRRSAEYARAAPPKLEANARGSRPIEHVDGVDEANGLRLVGHHERVRPGPAAEEADTVEQVTIGDARRREDEVIARGEVLGVVDPALVPVAHPGTALALVVAAIPEAGLDLATQAAQRGGGDHALRRAADAHDGVNACALDRARDRRREVAVGDQLDPGARPSQLLDERLVPGSVEDDHSDVGDLATERLRDPPDVLR